MNNLIKIGFIESPHGIKGELKVRPLTDHIERFSNLDHVFIGKENTQVFRIDYVRYLKQHVLLKLNGCDNRSMAENYKGLFCLIKKKDRLPLEKNRYYIDDLIGLSVYEDDRYLGKLIDVLQPGANDVYIVENETNRKKLYLPAIKDVVILINLEKQIMKVRLLDGLEQL